MSSNPFRRKANEGTPSTSGRTSFDINEERLQQVAQQAFAVDDEIEDAGTSGAIAKDTQPVHTTEKLPAKATAKLQSLPHENQEASRQVAGHEPTENATRDDPNAPTKSLADTPASAPPSSLSSDAPTRSPSTRSTRPPPPPPSRPTAPPAPPRPRRSVRKDRDEVPLQEPNLQEVPLSVNVVPASPIDGDPFAESKLRSISTHLDEPDTKYQVESSVAYQRKLEGEVESEYEEDSDSELSDTLVKIPSLTSRPVTAEPESIATSPPQAPNPFRKKSDGDGAPQAQVSEGESQENQPPPIRFGIQRSNSSHNAKTARQSMDVDAFKHLMLTGQTANTPDSITTTETSNLSKLSLLEGVEHSYTPRSSQDTGRSSHEVEEPDQLKGAPAVSPTPKAKPLPPKPRGQRHSIMGPPPRPELQPVGLHEQGESIASSEPPASPPKAPRPPVPLSRRISAQVSASPEGSLSIQSISLSQPPPPPPPPPSRRSGPSPKTQPTTPPASLEDQPPPLSLLSNSPAGVKKPEPPPARRSSKRLSAAPSRLQAFAEVSSPENGSKPLKGPAVPPPPPTRKKSYLSQSTIEGELNPEPQPRGSSSFDILDDLSKLQKEIDQLMGKV